MTTQYTPILKLALPVQGELSGTWGDVVNDNITSMIEQAIAGRLVINTWSSNSHVLTTANGTTAEARAAMLSLTDSGTQLSAAGTVVCPALSKTYIVKNGAGQIITVKTASGSGIAIPNGKTMLVYCDGTNVLEGVDHVVTLSAGTLTITGLTTFASLKGADATTVTGILDEDNMSSNSATKLVTQQSVKAYVDAQVGSFDTLAEVLANGNTTGGADIVASTDDKVQFRDAAIYINSSADGQLDIVADTEIQIAATTVDIDGAVDMATTLAVAGNVAFSSDLDVDGTTNLDVVDIDGAVDIATTALVTGVLTTTAATVFNGGFASNADSILGTDKKVQFRDAAIYINSSADGQLDIVADTEIQIAATTIDINGAINASGEIIAASLDISGNIDVDGTTNLDVVDIDGAVDMATTLTVGGNVDFNGDLDVDGTIEFDAISGTGSVAITDIADEDDMSSNSATKLATQQSIKAYVDSQVTAQDLDLTDGTTSISIDLDSETLSVLGGTGVTSTASGNGVTLAIDSTVTTLTGSQTLTNKTLTSPDVNTPDIDGGTIDGTVIGGATAAAGSFTTVGATGNITVGGTVDGVDIATRDGVLTTTTNTANAALPKAGGTMSGAIAMGTSKITGAGDPTAAQDVATKAYVDSQSGGGETLQQTLAIGNTVTTDTKIQFRDTGLYINSSADGQLDIVADTEIQIAATTVDLNGVLDVSGNIVVAGTVDGVDIATRDGVLTTTTNTANAALPKAGGTMTGTLALGDSVKATFGAGDDLQIFHDGTESFIRDVGTGGLKIDSNGTEISLRVNANENALVATSNGAVTAYYDNAAKLATTATGIDVTGTIVTDAITIAGAITEDAVTLTGTSTTIDISAATNFVHDLTGATTYTFSNPASTGNASSFTLKIIQDSTARAITWPSSVDWAGGTAPTLSSADNAVDVFAFYTIDGGTTYYGFTAGQAMA